MKTNRLYLTALLFIVSAALSYAGQAPEGEPAPQKMMTVGSHVMGGGFLGDVGELNDDLTGLGFGGLKDHSYNLGFGMVRSGWRLIHSFELKGVMWRPVDGTNSQTELYGVSGLINLGFNVLPPGGAFWLYPYLGAGFGYHTLRLREERMTLTEALTRPASDVMLTQRTAALQAGIGFDWQMQNKRRPDHSRMFGVRAGYLWDPSPSDDWNIHDISVTNGPDFSMSGFYGQIVIGHTRKRPVHWKKGACPVSQTQDQPQAE